MRGHTQIGTLKTRARSSLINGPLLRDALTSPVEGESVGTEDAAGRVEGSRWRRLCNRTRQRAPHNPAPMHPGMQVQAPWLTHQNWKMPIARPADDRSNSSS